MYLVHRIEIEHYTDKKIKNKSGSENYIHKIHMMHET